MPKTQKFNSRFFTSSLVILELLSNYLRDGSEKGYQILRSRFLLIKKNKLRIKWLLTEEIIKIYFPVINEKQIRRGNLEEIYQEVLDCESYLEFNNLVKTKYAKDKQEIIDYDDFMGKSFSKTDTIKKLHAIFDEASKDDYILSFYYPENSEKPKNGKRFLEDLTGYNFERGIIFIMYVFIHNRINSKRIPPSELFATYNGEIELFFKSMTKHLFQKIAKKESFPKNDLIDLFHLLYVSPGCLIYSKEKIIKKWVIEFQPESLYNGDEA
ncbi:hypothetical protein EHQ68_06220 [Leptospira congkakensis]|uniref:hypothetical protein n=1 Tax=Leptospira congkakensis TaxID=2484932 RepID=UPI001090E715|nr:hypothetical protein [Leptospira congkakensis]TGL90005.1 hypothetical protein EHQ68_06220 [Leptospira congkakensis]